MRALQPLLAVELLVANDGWVPGPVKAVSRRRRGPQASLYRTCHPAILGHRGRRLEQLSRVSQNRAAVQAGIVTQAPAQGGIAVERGEVAEQLTGADEQHGVTVDEGLMGDVARER